ncbi:MAG: Nucleotidyl transferase AbiEii toxin, Type system [Candidatus Eremiobacteraeota bacterium]|nr:Nucleotidyl transferase AbiEii toxin, Type system [Candidatus Eremiobacteraeota bacterium]
MASLATQPSLRYPKAVEPRKPEHPDPFAEAFLERLQDRPEAEQFVLGGGFALKHYLDFRATADIDAWWRAAPDLGALEAAREAFADVADRFGYSVRERASGTMTSIEAVNGHRKVFSFQVAVRDVEIERPVRSPWGRFPIETADENVAAKMNALVNRGAPRDFRDIREIVAAGIATTERCWQLWFAKNPGRDAGEARREVQRLLAGIEARRPLERLAPAERERAAELRAWFRTVFAAEPLGLDHGDEQHDAEEHPR